MFACAAAIEVLVNGDPKATAEEKRRVINALRESASHETGGPVRVVSFGEAARILGYKSKAGVYRAVRDGRLRGYYSRSDCRRATGVLISSIEGICK